MFILNGSQLHLIFIIVESNNKYVMPHIICFNENHIYILGVGFLIRLCACHMTTVYFIVRVI